MNRFFAFAAVALASLSGCIQTKSDVDVKPVDVNLNLSGTVNLNVNVNDARQNMQQITGQAPARVVNPADIGLPATPATQQSAMLPAEEPAHFISMEAKSDSVAPAVTLMVMFADPAATEKQLKDNISGRLPQVRYLLDTHLVGESHTGLLALPKDGTKLTAAQQAIFDAENADREALYVLQAKAKNSSRDEVGLNFYLARLGYAKDGDWIERHTNKTPNPWEWTTWPVAK